MLLGAGAELVTIGAVIPFVSLMADPQGVLQFPLLKDLFIRLGWQQPEAILLPMTILFLLVLLCATAIRLLLMWVSIRFVHALGYDIAVALYTRVLNQPYSFHITRNTSEIIAAVNKVQAVIGGAVKPVLEGATAIVLSIAIIAALVYIQPAATSVAAVTFMAAYLFIGVLVRFRIKANGKRIAAAKTQRVRCIQEGLGGIRDVILDNSQAQIAQTYARVDHRMRRAQATNMILKQMPRYLIEVTGVFLIVGLAVFLSAQSGGLISALPVLAALGLGAQRLLPLLQRIYTAWAAMTGNQQMFADVLGLLELPDSGPERAESAHPIPFQREIKLEQVSFSYTGGHEHVLEEISLKVVRGQWIGIVGPTGAGKSTLADLLMGLIEPTKGHILIDGVPINQDNRGQWRQRVSHVPQHIFLLDATVAENIAIGVPARQIDMERIRYAARCACIDDFIESKPQGYQATVGERGVQLSGGQRQRIGIARAIYRKADVIFLDEATSALDSATEQSVMESLCALGDHLTVFVIAHRVQTLRNCDVVLKLAAGKIVAKGSFEELIENQSEAASMVNE